MYMYMDMGCKKSNSNNIGIMSIINMCDTADRAQSSNTCTCTNMFWTFMNTQRGRERERERERERNMI